MINKVNRHMKSSKFLTVFILILAIANNIYGNNQHPIDSIDNKKIESQEIKNKNVMLNASSATKPREMNIGLPSTVGGTEIFEDGLPVSYYFWPHMSYMNWRGGNSYRKTELMSLNESALLSGNVGYTLNSETRLGTNKSEAHINYMLNYFGAQKFDINLAGNIAPNWYFSIGSFQNFDPGSKNLNYLKYQDRTQIYKGVLTHRWHEDRGEISLILKYADNMYSTDNKGPFIYVGDGSVKLMDGFNLGHDSYMPSDGLITYQDIVSGEILTRDLYDMNHSYSNEIGLSAKYNFRNGSLLKFNLRYKHAHSNWTSNSLTGLTYVDQTTGYTSSDGTPYEGNVQNRYSLYYQGRVNDLLGTLEYIQQFNTHKLHLGINQWYNSTELKTMTSNWAHTVKANPEHLLYNGQKFWQFNTGSEYYKGQENKLALFVSDNWQILDNLSLSYGFRLEYYHISGHSPMNPTTKDHYNDRTDGFNFTQKDIRQTPFKYNWINPIITANMHYSISEHIGFSGDYLFVRQRPRLENFAGQDYANLAPVDVQLGQFGIYFQNDWINLVSKISYIRKTNYKSRAQFSANINNVNETQTIATNYDIATLGWTTDFILSPFKGFQLHYMITWQKPQYKNFNASLTFSDGITRDFNFNNRKVTGVSQLLMEIDPSYTINKWHFWLSFRYFSKQYINKPNTLYFSPRWETFGGIDYQLNNYISLSANVINFLNEKGASGSISAADLIFDTSSYQNYLMAGGFIRPFTMELSLKLNF